MNQTKKLQYAAMSMSDLNEETPIPMVDLAVQYDALQSEIDSAIAAVLRSSRFIGGDAVRRFEQEFARFCGTDAAVGVANGSDAVYLALRGVGVGPDDEVITTPFTFIATAEGISRAGARIVFADIDLETFNIDPGAVEAAITSRTRVLLPVHLYGLPAPMDALKALAEKNGAELVEDAAQAHGAELSGRRAGTLGRVASFSFFPAKNLGAFGDAGAIVSSDVDLIERIRRLANHGSEVKYIHQTEGVSSRLDALQAAILSVKLRHLDGWNEKRRDVASRYGEGLADLPEIRRPKEGPGQRHVYHQFTIRLAERDALREHLVSRGIATAVHYPCALHLQDAYRYLGIREGTFPNAEKVAREVLSLPMYPELSARQTDRIIAAIRSFFGRD